ncbi:MAG: hypothetical protein NZ920_03665 [Aigarchaeota archaeon]|nr:hypothetical protein [Aigarchaeota archaeon]MDW8092282.1 hypothetical protein [Nitrososphaerota archaeon]
MRRVYSTNNSSGLIQASVDMLRFLKSRHDYRKISSMTKLPSSTLSRYVSGRTLPRYKNAYRIVNICSEVIKPGEIIKEVLSPPNEQDNLITISQDVQKVKIMALHAFSELLGVKINSVLAVDIVSIPIATYFASLTNSSLFFASEKPLWQEGEYVEIGYRVDGIASRQRLWIPLKSLDRRNSIVLFVSSVFSVSPLREIIRHFEKSRIPLAAICTLVAYREVWESILIPSGTKRVATLILDSK